MQYIHRLRLEIGFPVFAKGPLGPRRPSNELHTTRLSRAEMTAEMTAVALSQSLEEKKSYDTSMHVSAMREGLSVKIWRQLCMPASDHCALLR